MDVELLERHRRFQDQAAGIEEEFLQPTIGPGQTVAVLSRPLRSPLPIGWVICHSFGIEQVNLHRLEVLAARALAGAGFPVLRFHVQGYGDGQHRGEPVDVAWHLDGTADALSFLRRVSGVETAGLLGIRFGAMVAALVAESADVPFVGLWQPYATGSQFLTDFLQTALFEQMFDMTGRKAESPTGVREVLRREGWMDLNGFRLTRAAHDRIGAIDLTQDLQRFGGSALVIGLSRSGAMPEEAARLAAHLRSIGADCEEEAITERAAPMLGQHHFMKVGDGEVERDIFFQAFGAIAASTVRWAQGLLARGKGSRA